nr:5'-methylthioadenosine/adenosylhomocysteine nucleosidase [Spirochaeta isovalerica]
MGALDEEIEQFRQELQNIKIIEFNEHRFYKGLIDGHNVIVARSGVGKVLSAMMTQFLIDKYKPEGLIFTGIAGAINSRLSIGDILVGIDAVQHDMDVSRFNIPRGQIPGTEYRFIKSDSKLFDAAMSWKNENMNLIPGRILTGDQFIRNRSHKERQYLKEELSGDCVDMEGAAVALVCKVNNVPHVILRSISDKAEKNEKINLRDFFKNTSFNSKKIVLHILDEIDK